MFINTLFESPRTFFTALFLVVFSVCCHEFMHAFVALKMGDDTAARCGHLTLNPLRQMGLLSLIMLLFIGIAWGQVPVNRANFRSRAGMVLTSLAGPLTNFALWLIFIALCLITGLHSDNHFAISMLAYGAMLNFVLFVFNLLPIPGLDGFNILIEFFPGLFRRDSEVIKGAYLLMVILLFTCSDRLFMVAMNITLNTLELIHRAVAA